MFWALGKYTTALTTHQHYYFSLSLFTRRKYVHTNSSKVGRAHCLSSPQHCPSNTLLSSPHNVSTCVCLSNGSTSIWGTVSLTVVQLPITAPIIQYNTQCTHLIQKLITDQHQMVYLVSVDITDCCC